MDTSRRDAPGPLEQVRIELHRTEAGPAGTVRTPAGDWRFLGWEELLAVLREAIEEGPREGAAASTALSRRLSPQELEVARLVAAGASNKRAAAELHVSPKTIEFHLSAIYRKLGVTSRTQLTRLVIEDCREPE